MGSFNIPSDRKLLASLVHRPKKLKGTAVWLERDQRFDKIERIG